MFFLSCTVKLGEEKWVKDAKSLWGQIQPRSRVLPCPRQHGDLTCYWGRAEQGGGEKGEQAELIKTFTDWLPSSLILFKLSHLPTLNGKLSQLLPVSLWGQWPEEWGKGVKAAALHPRLGPGENVAPMEVGDISPSASWRSAPGKPYLLTWGDHSPAPLALEDS